MAQGDLGDRQPMYFDGRRTVLPGRALVTQRKKDLRQLFGLEEQLVIIREYNSALFESCYAEEMVHSQTKGMRVRLPSLKGVDVKGVPVRDYERYWVFANEHMI